VSQYGPNKQAFHSEESKRGGRKKRYLQGAYHVLVKKKGLLALTDGGRTLLLRKKALRYIDGTLLLGSDVEH